MKQPFTAQDMPVLLSAAREKNHVQPRRAYAYLLPTLLDRLRDDAPHRKSEAPEEYTMTNSQIREIVQRDLAFLLNTTNIESHIDSTRYPEAAASTINFGIPSLAGGYISEQRWAEIERIIRKAIANFEPRLIMSTLQVIPLLKDESATSYNVLMFEIRGQIQMNPYPMEFVVQSAMDLETNRMILK